MGPYMQDIAKDCEYLNAIIAYWMHNKNILLSEWSMGRDIVDAREMVNILLRREVAEAAKCYYSL